MKILYVVVRMNDSEDIRGIFSDYDEAWDVCNDLNDKLTFGFKVVTVSKNINIRNQEVNK